MLLLGRMLRKQIGWFSLTVAASVISISVSLWWNFLLSLIINAINDGAVISGRLVFAAVGAILAYTGIVSGTGLCSGWTCELMAHDLRMGYAQYISVLPLSKIENFNSGEYLSKLQNEIGDVSDYLRGSLFTIVDDIIRFFGTFSWMLLLNPRLALLANAPVLLHVCYTVFASRLIGETARKSQQANVKMNGFTDTLINVFPILRLFDASELIRGKFNSELAQWEESLIQEEQRRAKLMSLAAPLSYIPLMLLFLIGGAQISSGNTTLGTLYIFINLSKNVSGVMLNMPGRITAFRRFSVNMKRLETTVLIERRGVADSEHLC